MKQEKTFEEQHAEKMQKDQKKQSILKNVAKIFSYGGLISAIVGPLLVLSAGIVLGTGKYDDILDEKKGYIEEFKNSTAYVELVEEEKEKLKQQFLDNKISAYEYEGKLEMLKDDFYIEDVAAEHDSRIEDCNKRMKEESDKLGGMLSTGLISTFAAAPIALVAGGIAEDAHYNKYGPAFKDKSLLGKFYNNKRKKNLDYDEPNISGI